MQLYGADAGRYTTQVLWCNAQACAGWLHAIDLPRLITVHRFITVHPSFLLQNAGLQHDMASLAVALLGLPVGRLPAGGLGRFLLA